MPTFTNSTLPYYADQDPASEDLWYPPLLNEFIWLDGEAATKTIAQDFADKNLSRPVLKDYSETVYAHGNVSGAVTVNWQNGNHQTMTLTGNVTLTFSNAAPTGKLGAYILFITQDGTGGRTVTFPASHKATTGSTFAISGTAASTMTEVVMYTYDAGTLYRTKQGNVWS